MGKLHTKREFIRKGAHFRKVSSYVDIARVNPPMYARPQDLKKYGPFVACVKIGTGGTRFIATKPLAACAYGKNPRKALAAAMRMAAHRTSVRHGAYAGYRR